jgi:hypothetical protein
MILRLYYTKASSWAKEVYALLAELQKGSRRLNQFSQTVVFEFVTFLKRAFKKCDKLGYKCELGE